MTSPKVTSDPTGSGRPIPPELLTMILNNLVAVDDLGTVAVLARTARWINNSAIPFLYRTLTITKDNACALFAGVDECVCPNPTHNFPGRKVASLSHCERLVIDGVIPQDLVTAVHGLARSPVSSCCEDGIEPHWRPTARVFDKLRYVSITARGWLALDRNSLDIGLVSSLDLGGNPLMPPGLLLKAPYPPLFQLVGSSRPSQLCVTWPTESVVVDAVDQRFKEMEESGRSNLLTRELLQKAYTDRLRKAPRWLTHLTNAHWTTLKVVTLHSYARNSIRTGRGVRLLGDLVPTFRIDFAPALNLLKPDDSFSDYPPLVPNGIALDLYSVDSTLELLSPLSRPLRKTLVYTNFLAGLKLECGCANKFYQATRAAKRSTIDNWESQLRRAGNIAFPHPSDVLPCPCCSFLPTFASVDTDAPDIGREEPVEEDAPCEIDHPWEWPAGAWEGDQTEASHILTWSDEEWVARETRGTTRTWGTADCVDDYDPTQFFLMQQRYLDRYEDSWSDEDGRSGSEYDSD